jgi:glycosyltransferase involved in cell wall biosynthesis
MMDREPKPGWKVLMTVDAAGGVWRYALDLAAGLTPLGYETIFACFGPTPNPAQAQEAAKVGKLVLCDAPLDWMVEDEASLSKVPRLIADIAASEDVDLIHLNLPSQAAGLEVPLPVVVTAHSCVSTWFQSVRGHPAPEPWNWQLALNSRGFARADTVIMPSASHAALSRAVYGPIDRLHVVHNATRARPEAVAKTDFVFAAGRWWDDGKNGTALDAAAPDIAWPVLMAGANQGPNGQFVHLPNVQHRGELSHEETMILMRQAAIFVSPSLYEPFGLAALEAARSASALVLADIPTYRELWEGAALFADPRDSEALAAQINRLAGDAELQRTLGVQAQHRSAKFALERQAAAVSDIYQHILSPAQAPMAVEQA